MERPLWITWERQIRNRSMATLLGADLHELLWRGPRSVRYAVCGARTIASICRLRPGTVFAQNPSIALSCLLLLIRPLFGFRLAVDAHYVGVVSPRGGGWHQRLLDHINCSADLVIVTNSEHRLHVLQSGGKAVVCEDPLPDIAHFRTARPLEAKSVLYICSYDVDEPYHAAFEAARLLAAEGFTFFVTGNYRAAGIDASRHRHLTFTGYLPDEQYYAMLYRSAMVLDLTENDNCLVCGAYEAMAAERPLVTSDTPCLRSYFSAGTTFTDHTPAGIAEAIRHAWQERERLTGEIIEWKRAAHSREIARRDSIFHELFAAADGVCAARADAVERDAGKENACAEYSE